MDHGGAQLSVHEIVHWASAVVLVIGGMAVIGLAARARRRGSAGPATTTAVAAPPGLDAPTRSIGLMLAGLSLGAAAIHFAAAPSHYVELGDLGAGFLAAAVLQAAWARSILRGATRRTIRVGVAINAAILVAWLVSRTIGLPLGPTPFIPEPVGLPDGLSATFEALIVLGLIVLRLERTHRVAVRQPLVWPVLAVLVVPVLGLVMLTTSLASLAIVAGAEHGMPGAAGAHAEAAGHDSGN